MLELKNAFPRFFRLQYETIMRQALFALGCNETTVRQNFSYYKVSRLPDLKELKKGLLEIRFGRITISYLLDENNICCTGFLFLDDLSDATGFIKFCDKHFKATSLNNAWKNKNCSIKFIEEDSDSYFVFTSLKRLKNIFYD